MEEFKTPTEGSSLKARIIIAQHFEDIKNTAHRRYAHGEPRAEAVEQVLKEYFGTLHQGESCSSRVGYEDGQALGRNVVKPDLSVPSRKENRISPLRSYGRALRPCAGSTRERLSG